MMLSAVTVLAVSTLASGRQGCEYGWHQRDTKCYRYLGPESSYTFEEASYECRKRFDGHLVSIRTEQEQRFIETMFKDVLSYNNVWLGAKWQRGTPSGFLWEDRTIVRYNNRLLAPDNKNKSNLCLSMVVIPEYYGLWSAYDCNYYFSVMCEKLLSSFATALSAASFSLVFLPTCPFTNCEFIQINSLIA
ncbi:Neurocan core protein [Halotydeus destructor]|nr:Neurocan core protein [Halotydeus destructor]